MKTGGFKPLDRESPDPLYRQLARLFESRIRDRTWRPGDRLPSEDALSRDHAVSRITLRQAVDELVRKDLLVRKQGKGTFVTQTRVSHDLNRLHGLLGSLFTQASDASATLLRYELENPPVAVARAMQLKPRQPALAVDRLYLIGRRPVAFAHGWLSPKAAHVPRAKAELISTEDILRAAGIDVASAHVAIRAEAAGASIGKRLEMRPQDSLLVLHRTANDGDGRMVEWGHVCFCSDRYEIVCSSADAGRQPRRRELFDIRARAAKRMKV